MRPCGRQRRHRQAAAMPWQWLACHNDGDVGELTDSLHSIKPAGDKGWGMYLEHGTTDICDGSAGSSNTNGSTSVLAQPDRQAAIAAQLFAILTGGKQAGLLCQGPAQVTYLDGCWASKLCQADAFLPR